MSDRLARVLTTLVLTLGLGLGLSACGSAAEDAASTTPGQDNAEMTLKEIMVGLGEDSARVGDGIWVEDFEAISVAAEAIAKHPLVSDAERTSIQGVLGEDMPNFAKGDKAVHDTAMAMSEAAKAQDMALVLARNAQLQSECVACHTNFRDRLADR